MDISSLTEEQRQIAYMVGKEAERQGINPNFVLPMIFNESAFNQNVISKKGAIGVMQLMPDTAKSLGVDPHNLEQNIAGGVKLIKELVANPKIGDDPYKVLAGYNTTTKKRNEFLESGNIDVLPDETKNYMLNISSSYGGQLPNVTLQEQKSAQQAEQQDEDNRNDVEYNKFLRQNKAVGPVYIEGQNTPAMAGGIGFGVGASAGEVAAILQAKKEAADLAYKSAMNYVTGKKATPEPVLGETPGGKWGAKTGYGVGEGTVEDVSSKYKRMKPQGKISGRMTELYGMRKPGESADLVQRMIDRAKTAEAVAQEASLASKATSPLSWATKFISYPLKAGLGLGALAAGAQDIYNRVEQGAPGEATASGLSSLAGAVSPYLGPIAGPLVGGGALATQLILSAKDRDRYLQEHPEEFILEKTNVDPMGNIISMQEPTRSTPLSQPSVEVKNPPGTWIKNLRKDIKDSGGLTIADFLASGAILGADLAHRVRGD